MAADELCEGERERVHTFFGNVCEGGISIQLNSFINLMSLAAFLEMQVLFGTIATASERVSLNRGSGGTHNSDKRSSLETAQSHADFVKSSEWRTVLL